MIVSNLSKGHFLRVFGWSLSLKKNEKKKTFVRGLDNILLYILLWDLNVGSILKDYWFHFRKRIQRAWASCDIYKNLYENKWGKGQPGTWFGYRRHTASLIVSARALSDPVIVFFSGSIDDDDDVRLNKCSLTSFRRWCHDATNDLCFLVSLHLIFIM